ncbi:hypothetical protein [Mycoplasmopsis agassizii]|uniref:Uncharacterized protein n=1 Tax=Mycoplasmopsis agassizii TaxID=33922 RepID=A0ABX4H4X4_9BACT|nr:hypothetical protein [Mycoplasmopsis agassizii]PAF54939.1 hypothetical protein CJF60_04350 [Mycoplasmopsis agassizii]SMC17063.1 hypothetical protein SAMN02745179_00382 [Mycoplasmopsis agassizii]
MNKKKKDIIKSSRYIQHDDIEDFKNFDRYTQEKFNENDYEDAGYGNTEEEDVEEFYSSSEQYPSFDTNEFYPIEQYRRPTDFDITPENDFEEDEYQSKNKFDILSSDFNSFEQYKQYPLIPEDDFESDNSNYDLQYQDEDLNNNDQYNYYSQPTNPGSNLLSLSTQNYLPTTEFISNAPEIMPLYGPQSFNDHLPQYQNYNVPEIYETRIYDYANQLHTGYDSFNRAQQQLAQNNYPMLPEAQSNYTQNNLPALPSQITQQAQTGLVPVYSNPYYYTQEQNNPYATNNYTLPVAYDVNQYQGYQNTQSHNLRQISPVLENQIDHTHLVDVTNLHNFNPMTQSFVSPYRQAYDANVTNDFRLNVNEESLTYKSKERIKNLNYLLENNLITQGEYFKAKNKVIQNDQNEQFKTGELNIDFSRVKKGFNNSKNHRKNK